MTLPEQSDRAVAQTRAFLVRLTSPYVEGGIKGIRREVRAEASRMLRHYPYSCNGDCLDLDNAARQDIDTPATHATPGEGSKQGECTLTDEEREAVEWFARHSNHGMSMRRAAMLRSLLERMK